MTADIFVMKAKEAIPPYIRDKIVVNGSGSADKSDNSAVLLVSGEFKK
jgi:hypothetical protein